MEVYKSVWILRDLLYSQSIYRLVLTHKYFMISPTRHKVSKQTLDTAVTSIPDIDFRMAINEPMGEFFYDPWKLKQEFIGTVWEELYNSLEENKGEARIIKLSSKENYASHADIDDRWHLNLTGNKCYLIDLDENIMHKLENDGTWYTMDAGKRHSAANFGRGDRYQLVVRQLLNRSATATVKVKITAKDVTEDHARFLFDDTISPWINRANKNLKINNFFWMKDAVVFDVDIDELENIRSLLGEHLGIQIL